MVLRWLWLFFVFATPLFILTVMVYWSTTVADTLTVFGIRFRSRYTFWLVLVTSALPIYGVVNYLFFYGYWYGYNKLFPGQMWRVVLTEWSASLIITFLMIWLYMGELPTRNAVAAITFLAGALLAILWK